MSRTDEESKRAVTAASEGHPDLVDERLRLPERRRPPDARVALDLRESSDFALEERAVELDPREAEHQRRLEAERQTHQHAVELLRTRHAHAMRRQNTPTELIKAKAQAFLAIGMGLLALGTLCYLLLRSDTPMELKKDILKYVGGAIGGVGVGYALGKQAPRQVDE